jgi:hypothetical protein
MSNIGTAPDAPSNTSTTPSADKIESGLPRPMMSPPIMIVSSRLTTKSTEDPYITSVTNPRSLPKVRSIGPKPHNPGFLRPHE